MSISESIRISGPMRARESGPPAGHPTDSWAYVAGSPRRSRTRRRTVLFGASLVLLVPIGLHFHGADDHAGTAGITATAAIASNPESGQSQPQPEPESGAIDPTLSRALGKARTAAHAAGFDLVVTSGYRSTATQQRLYDEAAAKYGSEEVARRWVLPPAESDHVKGLAVDVGPREAAAWLETHGVRYGLCRRYVNEWWHFEDLAPAIGQKCPAMEPYAGG